MENRIIPITYDKALGGWATSDNTALRSELSPVLYLYESPVLNITFLSSVGVPLPLPSSGVSYLITIDDDFSESTEPFMVLTGDAVNVTGTWDDEGTFRDPVPGDGEMTISLSGAQASFLARIGDTALNSSTKLEIQIRDEATWALYAVYVAPLYCAGLINKDTPPTEDPPEGPVYVTTDMLASGDYVVTPGIAYGSVMFVLTPPPGAPMGLYVEDSNVPGDWYPLIGSSVGGAFALGADTNIGPVNL